MDVDQDQRLVMSRVGEGGSRPKWLDWVFVAALILCSILVTAVHVPQHKAVSPIDEYVYIDYLAKFPSQIIVHHGEDTGPYARQTLACRGVRSIGFYPEKLCKTAKTASSGSFPTDGTNSADIYTPLYFGATWLMAQPLQWLGVNDLTNAGRATGWVWLALAAVLLYMALKRLKIREELAFGLGVLMVGSLPAYWSNTYISTDATGLAAGAVMLYCLVRFDAVERGGAVLLIAMATLATLFKLQNYGAVAIVALALLVRAGIAVRQGGGDRQPIHLVGRWLRSRRVLTAVLALVIPIALQGVWLFIRAKLAVGVGGDQGTAQPFGLKAAASESFKFFQGPANGAIDPGLLGVSGMILSSVLAWVYIAGVIGTLVVRRAESIGQTLAISSLVVAFAIGPVLAVATIVSTGYYFPLPARYGISLIPIYLAGAGFLFTRKRWTSWCIMGVGIACFLLSLAIPES